MLIPIDDPEDPRVAPFRYLRERDLATRRDGRPGTFVAEGEVVLRLLLSENSRFRPLSILIAENRTEPLAGLLPGGSRGAPVYVAPSDVLEGIAGFSLHRGILALGERRDDGPVLPEGPSLVLSLLGLANHDNVGAAFRNAAAFGADAILLDRRSCDPLYRKAIRVSVGAALTVPFSRGGSEEEVIERLLAAGYTPFALSPAGSEPVERIVWPERTALVLGEEGRGLSASTIARLRSARIDMAPGFDSLNVATAAGIALHAASRAPARSL